MKPVREVITVGILTMLLALGGCSGGSDAPDSPAVPEGQAGLDQVRTEAVDLLRELAPGLARSTGGDLGSAAGTYRVTGYSGKTSYVEFTADVDLTGGTFDEEAAAARLRDAGLKVRAYDDPQGRRTVLGTGQGLRALVRDESDDGEVAVQVGRQGARVEDVTAEQRAQWRQETPIDLSS